MQSSLEKNWTVFTIQREPDNFAILIKNTELNGYQNVILENKTVPDKTQKMRLYLTPTKGGPQNLRFKK